ncbi:hypothetical protein Krac_1277 [Ktedonobacter racemifer DSM 44963]|uniref:Uncharacterized protein n=1 Tax=Ktedonobacter racemifer DSM 44963 TaxID=485913 RepID=D6U6Q0_KTERA|nr:hypothetical protein Krac_1277 [Ktedonobacter racemifer DSM 44963]
MAGVFSLVIQPFLVCLECFIASFMGHLVFSGAKRELIALW